MPDPLLALTGTGKTLSLITGCLHWLEDFRANHESQERRGQPAEGEGALPDWVLAQAEEQRRQEQHEANAASERVQELRARARVIKEPVEKSGNMSGDSDSDAELLLAEPGPALVDALGSDSDGDDTLQPGIDLNVKKTQVRMQGDWLVV